MPNAAETAIITQQFADKYNVDLDSVRRDAAKIRDLVGDIKLNPISSAEIYRNSPTFSSDDSLAFVPEIETLEFSEVASDPRLNSRRIEQNLEEAAGYLQTCLLQRQQYGEIAKLRNDTRFKGEEFIRLDLVHLEEVEKGLYKLPWQEAQDDKTALEKAEVEASNQCQIIDDMIQSKPSGKRYSAVLSDPSVAQLIDKTAYIAVNIANANKLNVDQASRMTTEYHSCVEYATWMQMLAAAKGNIAQLDGKISTAKRKEIYLLADEGFRAARAAISRQLALLQMAEHCRPNSPLNYSERLDRQQMLFTANMRALIERVVSLKSALRDYYKIDIPLDTPARGRILDALSVWLVNVQDELLKYKRAERVSVLTVFSLTPVNVTPRDLIGTEYDVFSCEVVVRDEDLPGANALLRGVAVEYVGSYNRPISLDVLPPRESFAAADVGLKSDRMRFGRACAFTPESDPKPQYMGLFWNGPAEGAWRVEGQFDQNVGDIKSILIHLWLACF